MPRLDPDLLLSSYGYDLPTELIAQFPSARRDDCRLLTFERSSGHHQHARFSDLPDLLKNPAVLVFNDSKVIHARVPARRLSGGHVELLFLGRSGPFYQAMAKPSKRLKPGEKLLSGKDPRVSFNLLEALGDGRWQVAMEPDLFWPERMGDIGDLPLPPYISRPLGATPGDVEDYQCVYARDPGSVAAPTAGLHFSEALLERLRERDFELQYLTLHVSADTFRPVRTEHLSDHVMHTEELRLSDSCAASLLAARRAGKRIIAIGTTSVRVLESCADRLDEGLGYQGSSNLFLHPPKKLRWVDGLITNFHLPHSSLLMLVSCLCGREKLLELYREAISEKYRFFSYGDAMCIL